MNRRRFLLVCSAALVFAPAMARAEDAATPPAGMVLVPAGAFPMGTDERDENGEGHHIRTYDDARPRHSVTLPAFFIDKTEVTNAQYKEFCDKTRYPAPPQWDKTFPEGQGNYPVTRVSWWEARAYAEWRGKRLPTEQEWEKAARGTDARAYPWGDAWDASKCVWDTDGPQNVGSKPDGASPYGALDMAANAFEWTDSWYEAYPNAPVKFPEYGQQLKVIRGGPWWGFENIARTYYRSVARAGTRVELIGFRCAQSVK